MPANSTTLVDVVAVDLPGLQPRSAGESERRTSEITLSHRTSSIGLGSCSSGASCKIISFTGHSTSRSGCSKTQLIGGRVVCVERRSHRILRALQRIDVALDEVAVGVDVSVTGDGAAFAPTGQDRSPSVNNYRWVSTELSVPQRLRDDGMPATSMTTTA